jgi:hypothetical protein
LAHALDVSPQELRRPAKVEEPVPLGDAPDTGPSLLDKALDAVRHDEEKSSRAVNRLFASEGTLRNTNISDFEEDKFRTELRTRGFPDEYFEDFIWPLVVKAFRADRLEQELTRLREEHGREASQAQDAGEQVAEQAQDTAEQVAEQAHSTPVRSADS